MTAPRVKLDIDTTREKLAALGLGYATSALEGLLSEAVRAEMQAHVFLDRLLDAERSGREERRVRTMLKTAKIPTGATLENFDFAFQPAIERSRLGPNLRSSSSFLPTSASATRQSEMKPSALRISAMFDFSLL